MTAPCDQCRGPLYGCDVLTGNTVCVECVRRSLDRAQQPASEWDIFVAALNKAAVGSVVRANDVRPLIRGRIYHKHIGQFYTKAKSTGLLTPLRRERSGDSTGRNTHHDAGVYELRSAA